MRRIGRHVFDDGAQQRHQPRVGAGNRHDGRRRRDQFDLAAQQAGILYPVPLQTKAFAALGDDVEHAELLHVPIGDVRQRAHRVRLGRLVAGDGDFLAFGDQADAEGGGFLEADLGHVHVALLENPHRQPPAGKQHGLQGKQGNDHEAAFAEDGVAGVVTAAATGMANKRAATRPLMVPKTSAAEANSGSR